MTYRDVCGKDESVWFILSDMKKEGRRFLQWAKSLGCVWLNGDEIDPSEGTDFFTLSIHANGKLANVPAMARVDKQCKKIKKVVFTDYEKTLKKKLP